MPTPCSVTPSSGVVFGKCARRERQERQGFGVWGGSVIIRYYYWCTGLSQHQNVPIYPNTLPLLYTRNCSKHFVCINPFNLIMKMSPHFFSLVLTLNTDTHKHTYTYVLYIYIYVCMYISLYMYILTWFLIKVILYVYM